MKTNCKHGYKHSNKLTGDYKVLTLEEKKNLTYRTELYIQGNCGCYLRIRVNGKPKTWKRTPGKVQIPYSYGLYEHGYITENDEVRQIIY